MKRSAVPVALTLLLALGATVGGLRAASPSEALASQCTLSVLSGSVEIQTAQTTDWREGADGTTLAVGTRVKTAANSYALLTFFEGSTIRLEPRTDVEIQQVEGTQGQSTRIVLKQWLGRTWSRVVKMADPGSHYEIETPSATALVRGTLFATEVDESGATEVTTTEGLVSVIAQGEEVYLPPSQQSTVQVGSSPSEPETVPASKNVLTIRVSAPGVGSLRDPTGSSTGALATGTSFNQIVGSSSSTSAEGAQQITVPQPAGGEYVVALRYLSQGTAHFSIEAQSDGKLVFEHSGAFEAAGEDGWLIHFNLQIEGGQIVGGNVTAIEPLGEEAPEKIVVPGSAEPSLTQTESPAHIECTAECEHQGQNQDCESVRGQGQTDDDIRSLLGDYLTPGAEEDLGLDSEQGHDEPQVSAADGLNDEQPQGDEDDNEQHQDSDEAQVSAADGLNDEQPQGDEDDSGQDQDNDQGNDEGNDQGQVSAADDKDKDKDDEQPQGDEDDSGQDLDNDQGKDEGNDQGDDQANAGQSQGNGNAPVCAANRQNDKQPQGDEDDSGQDHGDGQDNGKARGNGKDRVLASDINQDEGTADLA